MADNRENNSLDLCEYSPGNATENKNTIMPFLKNINLIVKQPDRHAFFRSFQCEADFESLLSVGLLRGFLELSPVRCRVAGNPVRASCFRVFGE
jgi:hypothetical protein